MYLVKKGTEVNHPEVLRHAEDTLTENVRRVILGSKDDKVCKIPCYLIGDGGRAGHVAHALKEVVYAGGENGNREVKYNPRDAITISSVGLRILKDKLGD